MANENTLARRAKTAEKASKAAESATLETMLGQPAEATFAGRAVKVFRVSLGRLPRLALAMEALGQLGLFMLMEDRPDMLVRLNQMAGGEGAEITAEDAALGLKLMLLQPSAEQVEAMIEIAETVLNGKGQAVSREEIEEHMAPMEFVAIYRLAVTISELNP